MFIAMPRVYTSYTQAILILVPLMLTTGSIHSVLKLDSRHFGVVAASDYKSLGIDSLSVQQSDLLTVLRFLFVAVYDINKSTMREKDHYELEFVRYLLNTHNDDICCLASVSCKYSNVIM